MAASGGFEIKVKGAKEVERALDKLPADVQSALAKEKRRLAKNLVAKLRRAVISGTKVGPSGRPMGTKVLPTIRQSGDDVTAGPHPMLFGTEFGMNRKSGWYDKPWFQDNPHLQYFRHAGRDGYWWNPTIRRSEPDAEAAVQRAVDDALNHWSA